MPTLASLETAARQAFAFDDAAQDCEVVKALAAYAALRHALVAPDTLPGVLLSALKSRVVEAVLKYPDSGADTPALTAANKVLRAYACYLEAVALEAQHALAGAACKVVGNG